MSKTTSKRKTVHAREVTTESGTPVKAPYSNFKKRARQARKSAAAKNAAEYRPGQDELLAVHQLRKSYRKSNLDIEVLRGVSFSVKEGEFVSIVGQSGSGKSTLLHLMGTLDAPDEGEIYFEGRRIDNLKSRAKDQLRNNRFGLIFQFYHLLPELTTLENVLVPKMIRHSTMGYWLNRRQYTERAKHLLEIVGLTHRLTHKPSELSGGEMQRTAIARALIAQPSVLLADEPTGNLDSKNGDEILTVLRRLNEKEKVTTLMVTHDMKIAGETDRIVQLVDGRVKRDAA